MTKDMESVYVIAEAGSCHEERLSNALELIRAAAAAGANTCKFQFWSNPARMRERRRITTSGAYDQGSLRPEWFPNLRTVCHDLGMAFACSVYLPEDVETVSEYVDVFKVSSFECRDEPLVEKIMKIRGERPMFISTGMQDGDEDIEHLSWYMGSGEFIQLHCVSAYPCPVEEANLGAIEPHEGYSDHTRMVLTGALAVAAGADYLEVHFRLNTTSESCPDYPVSLSPAELKNYIRWARVAYQMRGTGEKVIQPSERPNLAHRVVS